MATVGYTTIGANTDSTGSSGNINPTGVLITMPVAASLTKITCYVANNNITNSPNCTIYAGTAGARNSSVIGTTGVSAVTTSFGFVDFAFGGAGFPASATTYFLQFNGDGGNGPGGNIGQIKYDTGGGANTSYFVGDSGTLVYESKRYTLYATYPDPTGGFNIALV